MKKYSWTSSNSGITLISLIITIIVALILVSVGINKIVESDLIGNTEEAVNLTNNRVQTQQGRVDELLGIYDGIVDDTQEGPGDTGGDAEGDTGGDSGGDTDNSAPEFTNVPYIDTNTYTSTVIACIYTDADGDTVTPKLYVWKTAEAQSTAGSYTASFSSNYNDEPNYSEFYLERHLDPSTEYSYYVEITDGKETVTSEIQTFITAGKPPVLAGEKATETSIYSDGTDTAVIPAGFTVSGASTEKYIDDGLVLYLIDDKTDAEIAAIDWTNGTTVANLQKTYDQFVWIPMPKENINNMYMCQSEDGTKSCRITVQELDGEEVAYCTTHSSTAMAGRLYATGTGENYNASLTTQTYASEGLREPDTVSSHYDEYTTNLDQLNGILGTSYSSASSLKTDLQNEYNEIVKSVYQNEGFYIGRYETSGMTNSNTNATIKVVAGSDNSTNASISSVTWYRMYAQQKMYASNKELTTSIGSTMIQGAAYDQVMKFIDPTTSFVKTTGRVGQGSSKFTKTPYQTGGLNYESVYTGTVTYNDVAKNIYDLEGNVRAFTTEACSSDNRIARGGNDGYGSCSPSYRTNHTPGIQNASYANIGSVCQLYVK